MACKFGGVVLTYRLQTCHERVRAVVQILSTNPTPAMKNSYAHRQWLGAALLVLLLPTVGLAQETIDNGVIQTFLFNNGAVGSDDCLSGGFTYGGQQALCGSVFLLGVNPSTVIGNPYQVGAASEWGPGSTGPSTSFPYPSLPFGKKAVFSSNTGPAVNVEVNAYYGASTPYVVFQYEITNVSGGTLSNLYPGLWMDWDVDGPDFQANLAAASGDLQYVYDGNQSVPQHFGAAILNSALGGWTCFSSYSHLDGDIYQELSTPGPATCTANDIRGPVGGAPMTLANGQTGVFIAAILGGDNAANIMANAVDAAMAIPVELVSFGATLNGIDVRLSWATASETNNAGFEVQMDAGAGFQALAFVDGHGTTTEAQTYTHTARGLDPGTYHFRLKQIDYDGAFEYHGDIEVSVATPDHYVLMPAYPNPFNPEATVRFAVRESAPVTMTLHDALGRQVSTLYSGTPEANQTLSVRIDGSGLPSGMYLVRLKGSGFSDSQAVTLLK